MKKLFTLLVLFISLISFSQEQFTYTKEGLNPKYIVIDFSGKTQNELYNSTLNWIKDNYRNPDEVIKSTIENNRIRIEGVNSNSLCVKTMGISSCNSAKYTIEFEFKEGKLRMLPSELSQYIAPSRRSIVNGWVDVSLKNGEFAYNKKGILRNSYETFVPSIENIFNNTSESLKNYINSNKQSTESSDW